MMWRRIRMLGAAGAAVAVMAACAGEGAQAARQPQRPLKVVGQFELHSLDPSTSGGFFTRLQVAETLVDADLRGALQPGLATSWEASPDGLTWRFALRPDAALPRRNCRNRRRRRRCAGDRPDQGGNAAGDGSRQGNCGRRREVRVDLAKPFAPLAAVLAHTSTQILAPSSYGPDRAVTKVVGLRPLPGRAAGTAGHDRIDGVRAVAGQEAGHHRGGVPGRGTVGKPGADGRERPGRCHLRHGPDQPAAAQTGRQAGHRRCHPSPHHPAQGQCRPRHPR